MVMPQGVFPMVPGQPHVALGAPRGSALHPARRLGRNARYANANSRYPAAATASQRARKAGWPPL